MKPPTSISMTITDYRNKLKAKIITAERTKDAERYVYTAVKSLQDCKVHAYIIERFITRMIGELERLSMQEKETGRLLNIKAAMNKLNLYNSGQLS